MFVLGLAAAVSLLGSAPAFADCAAPYTSDNVLEDLGNVESFLLNANNDAASAAAKGMQSKIGCLTEVLPPIILGRAYRGMGAGLYVGGDLTRSKDWFATAISIDPTFEYGTQDLPADHPVLSIYSDVKRVGLDPVVTVEGKSFVPGVHYLDGKKIVTPAAAPAMPHLYQKQVDGNVSTWLIEGEYFPDNVLNNGGSSASASGTAPAGGKDPKAGKPPKGGTVAAVTPPKVTTITRKRPPEKTPLMIGGVVVVGGAGAIYFLAMGARADFEGAKTLADVDKFKKTTNTMVVASSAVLAVGVGTLSWGLIVDDHGTPLPAVNFRF